MKCIRNSKNVILVLNSNITLSKFLSKPFKLNELVVVMQRVLFRRLVQYVINYIRLKTRGVNERNVHFVTKKYIYLFIDTIYTDSVCSNRLIRNAFIDARAPK